MRTWTLLSITAAAALLGLAGRAAAQECESDADCVASYTCEVVGESGCGFACPEGEPDCKPPPDADCAVMQYKACIPGPCSSDADCEDGMVCFEQESVSCPPSAEIDCPPGADCPKPEPVDCETTLTSSCVPRYAVPCEVDADCGDGFDCVEDIAYACGGSAPSSGGGSDPGDPGAAGGAAPEPAPLPQEPPTCTEEPLGSFHCEAREVECEADADCPSDWTCQENYSRPVCGGAMIDPAIPPPADSPAEPSGTCPDAIPANCRVCADGSCGAAECFEGAWKLVCPEDAEQDPATPPVPPEEVPIDDCGVDPNLPARICAPPFSDLGWGGFAIAEDGIAASGTAGGVPASDPQAPGASPVPDRADQDQAASGDDKNVSLGSGETADEPKADSGGLCTVSAPGAASGNALGVFSVLGLSLLGLRRKRRS